VGVGFDRNRRMLVKRSTEKISTKPVPQRAATDAAVPLSSR